MFKLTFEGNTAWISFVFGTTDLKDVGKIRGADEKLSTKDRPSPASPPSSHV